MLRNVHLHGHLGKLFGKVHRFEVETAAEAIRALNVNFPKFMETMKEGSYYVIRGRRHGGLSLELEDVTAFKLGKADLHIVPVTKGSGEGGGKGGGGLKMILGVALIGAAVFFSGGLAAGGAGLLAGMGQTAFSIAGMGITWGNIAMVGVALTLSGVSQMLSPQEKSQDETKKTDSFMFSGPINAAAQGNPVPLIYGRVMTGSIPISAGIDIENIGTGS